MPSYRDIPTFGRDTIRRFANNVSEMKKLAARDFEDILQVCTLSFYLYIPSNISFECAMPVFEALLPAPFDGMLQDLLFVFSSWHGIAKLRLHTDTTLTYLEELTQVFGSLIRRFTSQTFTAFTTYELPREAAARGRRRARKATDITATKTLQPPSNPEKQIKQLNLSTYKLHSMGDYASTIRKFGTIDSYSTQVV